MILRTVLIISSLFSFFKGQVTEHSFGEKYKEVDTLSVLNLKNKIYGKDKIKILRVVAIKSDEEEEDAIREWIRILKNDSAIASIWIPKGMEIKNFGVSGVGKTKNGFLISTFSGGGNYFYSRTLFFNYRGDNFYFEKMDAEDYIHDKDYTMTGTMIINPPIRADKFILEDNLDM